MSCRWVQNSVILTDTERSSPVLSLYHYRSYRSLLFKFSTLLRFSSHPLGGGLRDYWSTKHLSLRLRRQQHAVNSSQQWQHGIWGTGQLVTTLCFSHRSTRHTILGCDELTVWRVVWHPKGWRPAALIFCRQLVSQLTEHQYLRC